MSSGDIEGKARGWEEVWAALRKCNLPNFPGSTGIQQALAWIEILRKAYDEHASLGGPAGDGWKLDMFAAESLSGLRSQESEPGVCHWTPEEAAEMAYSDALAMLAERKRILANDKP